MGKQKRSKVTLVAGVPVEEGNWKEASMAFRKGEAIEKETGYAETHFNSIFKQFMDIARGQHVDVKEAGHEADRLQIMYYICYQMFDRMQNEQIVSSKLKDYIKELEAQRALVVSPVITVELEDARAEIEKWKTANQGNYDLYCDSDRALKALEKSLDKAREEISLRESQVMEHRREFGAKNEKIAELEIELIDAKKATAALKESVDREIDRLRAENDSLLSHIGEMQYAKPIKADDNIDESMLAHLSKLKVVAGQIALNQSETIPTEPISDKAGRSAFQPSLYRIRQEEVLEQFSLPLADQCANEWCQEQFKIKDGSIFELTNERNQLKKDNGEVGEALKYANALLMQFKGQVATYNDVIKLMARTMLEK